MGKESWQTTRIYKNNLPDSCCASRAKRVFVNYRLTWQCFVLSLKLKRLCSGRPPAGQSPWWPTPLKAVFPLVLGLAGAGSGCSIWCRQGHTLLVHPLGLRAHDETEEVLIWYGRPSCRWRGRSTALVIQSGALKDKATVESLTMDTQTGCFHPFLHVAVSVTWHLTSMSKKSSSGSALSALAIRWLSTAWLLFWLSLRPGRLPPAADVSSTRRPCAPDTFADSDTATERELSSVQEGFVFSMNTCTYTSWWPVAVTPDHCLMITCCPCSVLSSAGRPCGCSGSDSAGQRSPRLRAYRD